MLYPNGHFQASFIRSEFCPGVRLLSSVVTENIKNGVVI
jgi:hypothetical protein